jgi:electron transport complex protein RnfD
MVQSYFSNGATLIQLALSICACFCAEGAILKLRNRPFKTLLDGSCLVTAMLIALSIPANSPWWIVVIGAIFAIIISKQLYGGLGHNIFNPAMVAYVVLIISFPIQITIWPDTIQIPNFTQFISSIWSHPIDGMSQATPLDAIKTAQRLQITASEYLSRSALIGQTNQWLGLYWPQSSFWVNLAYLAGGLFLIRKRVISWHLPGYFLSTLLICSCLLLLISSDQFTPAVFNLFSGATMIAAFFIITDPITAPASKTGRKYYAILIAIIVMIIRTWGIIQMLLHLQSCLPIFVYQ